MPLLKKHPLTGFFVLAFLLPWSVWATTITQEHGMLSWHIPQPLAFWLGLTIAAYTAAALSGGKSAVMDLLKRLVRLKVSPKWYAASLMAMPVIAALSLAIFRVLGGADGHIGTEIAASALLPYLLIETWLFLITEETAWRGFALPRLQGRFSPLKASLLLGLLWGLWHIPLFFITDSFQASLPFAGFLVSAIATSVLASWIFNNTGGSVFLAALFHAATDLAIGYAGVMSDSRALFWLFVLTQVTAAIAVSRTRAFSPSIAKNKDLIYKEAI